MQVNNLLLTFQLYENKRSLCLVFAFLCPYTYLFQISREFCENCCGEKTIPHLLTYIHTLQCYIQVTNGSTVKPITSPLSNHQRRGGSISELFLLIFVFVMWFFSIYISTYLQFILP
jgi:hypothetical protein